MASKSPLKFWRLYCPKAEVRLDITLKCGQSFRWKLLEQEEGGEEKSKSGEKFYIGVVRRRVWVVGRDGEDLLFSCVNGTEGGEEEAKLKMELEDYLQLKVGLEALYQSWAAADPLFAEVAEKYPGVRILRQDPVENVFSFICSANNHISRISSMVESLCTEWGESLGWYKGKEYFAFPAIEKLAEEGVEARLRELGFGYRAKYIQQSAARLMSLGGATWLLGLRNKPLLEARAELMQLAGVGPKVADCILLMSLDQPGSVPVDTHMLNIARRYLPHLAAQKSITGKVHKEVGEHFRSLLGPWAGWAHSVLFSADLKHLQQLKSDNSEPQDQKASHIKEETDQDSKKVLEEVKKKKFKEEIPGRIKPEMSTIKEEEGIMKSGTGGSGECREEVKVNDIEAVKTETLIKNSSVKANCKPVRKLKNKTSPSVGEISPFRRKKLNT